VVLRDGVLWTEYYTSRTDRDYPWLLGMYLPTDLWMARLPLAALAAAGARMQSGARSMSLTSGPPGRFRLQ
jgi:hypothetical protein